MSRDFCVTSTSTVRYARTDGGSLPDDALVVNHDLDRFNRLADFQVLHHLLTVEGEERT